jgi:ATP-dependent helicase/nuclease subunit A
VGKVGNALRIYTVHEAKGLEAPIVWLLDANDTRSKYDAYGVLLDWPANADRPVHFSLYANLASQGRKRLHMFEAEENYARREGMNLLYVAITRAKQVLLVSGNGKNKEIEERKNVMSWYDRIAKLGLNAGNPLLERAGASADAIHQPLVKLDEAMQRSIPTGMRAANETLEQRRGTWLHALLQQLTMPDAIADQAAMQTKYGIPTEEMNTLWQQAQRLLTQSALQRFFDTSMHLRAYNEMPYVNAQGELKRIDRLVEFESEVWVLDYKMGKNHDSAPYHSQMAEYRSAMQSVYRDKEVRCALIFSDGTLCDV